MKIKTEVINNKWVVCIEITESSLKPYKVWLARKYHVNREIYYKLNFYDTKQKATRRFRDLKKLVGGV